jgi:methyl-accepting chemotaxis protein
MGFKDMKLSVKLMIGFLAVALIVVAVGAFGISNINKIDEQVTGMGKLVVVAKASSNIKYGVARAEFQFMNIYTAEDLTSLESYYTKYQESVKTVEDNSKLVLENSKLQTTKDLATQINDVMTNNMKPLMAELYPMVQAKLSGKSYDTKRYEQMNLEIDKIAPLVLDKFTKIDANIQVVEDDRNKIANETVSSAIIFTSVMTLVAVLMAIAIGLYLSYLITKPIKILEEASSKMADGDLTVKIDHDITTSKDEVGSLASSFSVMLENLRSLVFNISQNASISASSAQELSASSEEVNSSMQQVASTIQEVAKGAQTVSKGTSDAQDASKRTSESAKAGSSSAVLVHENMLTISTSTKEGAEKIKALGSKSVEIGKIVETIKGISEQTNLLALNAAIEAARAGEAGRGFAVVADEVRKLAEESGKASGQIADLINSIQKEITDAVTTMDKNTNQVDAGSKSVEEALKAFDVIPQLVDTTNKVLSEIAAIAEENAAASEEVSSSSQQVTSAMQQVSSSAQQLSTSAEELQRMVSKFKIDNTAAKQEAKQETAIKPAMRETQYSPQLKQKFSHLIKK